jgi:hypothetical protein
MVTEWLWDGGLSYICAWQAGLDFMQCTGTGCMVNHLSGERGTDVFILCTTIGRTPDIWMLCDRIYKLWLVIANESRWLLHCNSDRSLTE